MHTFLRGSESISEKLQQIPKRRSKLWQISLALRIIQLFCHQSN